MGCRHGLRNLLARSLYRDYSAQFPASNTARRSSKLRLTPHPERASGIAPTSWASTNRSAHATLPPRFAPTGQPRP